MREWNIHSAGFVTDILMTQKFSVILYMHKSHNTPPLSQPPEVCIIIVCNLSWDMEMSQEKSKTMHMQILGEGGGVKEVCYGICASRELFASKKHTSNFTHFWELYKTSVNLYCNVILFYSTHIFPHRERKWYCYSWEKSSVVIRS